MGDRSQLSIPTRSVSEEPPQALANASGWYGDRTRNLIMADILSQHWLLSRRHVLRGVGVALALPLFDCMRPLLAADKAVRPKRSVFIYLPNGVNTAAYEMTTAGPDYKLSKPLAALEKHRK